MPPNFRNFAGYTTQQLVDIVDHLGNAEAVMLGKVARRLERGIDEDGWAERKLAELGIMRREAETELDKALDVATNLTRASTAEAYEVGHLAGLGEVRSVALTEPFTVAVNRQALDTLIAKAAGNLQNTRLPVVRAVVDAYRTVIVQSSAEVTLGAVTRREATQRALNRFADRGIVAFMDNAGRRWELSTYSEMSIRTTTTQAAVQGHMTSLTDNGFDLVIVSNHSNECPLCRPHEGKVFSLQGFSREYPSIDSADGLWHPGCRHRTSLYIEGVTEPITDTEDPAGYELVQEQRRLERGVRQWKRRQEVALSDAERNTSASKVREWQSRLKEHVDGNDLKRLRYREQIRGPA
jgi:hypothetical protein